jgi:hypothetical protein
VLAIGGSDGGTPEYFLELLVREGFACLALTYWGARDTQMTFTDIPLERVERGLRWLAAYPRVRNARSSSICVAKRTAQRAEDNPGGDAERGP